jgi:transcriptional regulator with XRE-family HTH domain
MTHVIISGVDEPVSDKVYAQVVGRRIASARTYRRWSQSRLGDAAGLHYTFIGNLERSERHAQFPVMRRIALALGTPIGELLGEPTAEELRLVEEDRR